MTEIEAKVDEKGRILIPAEIRKEMGIEPQSRVRAKVEEVIPRRSFVKTAKGSLRGAGDAVELLHKESPFR